jgi:hypothetical protein
LMRICCGGGKCHHRSGCAIKEFALIAVKL